MFGFSGPRILGFGEVGLSTFGAWGVRAREGFLRDALGFLAAGDVVHNSQP